MHVGHAIAAHATDYVRSWVNVGHELIAASLLIMAGGGNGKPLDYGELERWTRASSERGGVSARGAVF